MTRIERIHVWVADQFNAAHVGTVAQDLIDVATGNREGNRWEREALDRIFPEDAGRYDEREETDLSAPAPTHGVYQNENGFIIW